MGCQKVLAVMDTDHNLTIEVDGEKVKVFQVHDALIEDGKVKMFYVYERADVPKTK